MCNGSTIIPDEDSESIEELDIDSAEENNADEQCTRTIPTVIPTVFCWEHGGHEVFLSGSFSNWNARIPMNLRYWSGA